MYMKILSVNFFAQTSGLNILAFSTFCTLILLVHFNFISLLILSRLLILSFYLLKRTIYLKPPESFTIPCICTTKNPVCATFLSFIDISSVKITVYALIHRSSVSPVNPYYAVHIGTGINFLSHVVLSLFK